MVKLNRVFVVALIFAFTFQLAAQQIETDPNGLAINFDLPKLHFSKTKINNREYDEIAFESCGFITTEGDPRLPVNRVMIGVPIGAEISASVSHKITQQKNNFHIIPNPYAKVKTEKDLFSIEHDFRENRDLDLFPSSIVEIIYDGMMRDQRIITVEIRPIQYDHRSRSIKTHTQIQIRIDFRGNYSAPSLLQIENDNYHFEKLFSDRLANYDQAKNFRSPKRLAFAPIQTPQKDRYKIFVDQTGIYRLTAQELIENWGIDLREKDPRFFQIFHDGKQIPIYVHGESDRKFEIGDHIEFFGHKSESRYTNWNIYWLQIGENFGQRIAEISATPSDPTAKIVPSFRSKLSFEEDHLHSVLQHVTPVKISPNDKHAWFDRTEDWFWTGIKNSGDLDQIHLEFPLYDLTRSFDQPKIRVDLQGGDPTPHEILISLNDIRVEVARFISQDRVTAEKTVRLWDDIRDATNGEMNTITLSRVDDTVEDDTTKYPYLIYLDQFEIEYTRLFRAVRDQLNFSSPISDDDYEIRKRRNLEYKIEAFISPRVEIFEHDGKQITAIMKNPRIQKIELDQKSRDRLRNITDEIPPQIAYNAIFQAVDSHDSQFFAVSDLGVKKPTKIQKISPSSLISDQNGADYLVIAHPIYFDEAQKLVDWRSTPKGGNLRSKLINVEEIYDLFSGGMVDPKAIKQFLKFAYENWQSPSFSHVVIFGDGTWDFRGFDKKTYPDTTPEELGYIPTHYIWTNVFGQTSTDHWFTTISGLDELPDFFIGRIPVETHEHAHDIVEKIINYESDRPNGKWRRRIISVADNEVSNSGDFIFRKSLNEIAQNHTLLGYETVKIFLEDVIKEVKSDPIKYGNELPRRIAKDMVIEALSDGGVIAQYAGHGGRVVWAHEAIFDNNSVDLLDQTDQTPFMLVLSCYNGYFDAPGEPSMAEKLLRHKRGGIIGMLSATRLTYGSGNDALNRVIFDALFKRNVRQIGAISLESRIDVLRNEGSGQIDVMMAYTLFGDPAMKLAMAENEIQLEIETKTVAPKQILKISEAQISTVEYKPQKNAKIYTPINFNGTAEIKAVFPGVTRTIQTTDGEIDLYSGDVEIVKTVQAINGKIPATTFDVPIEISAGLGHVEIYAENLMEIAVGGASFSVQNPKIIDIQVSSSSDRRFEIATKIADDQGIRKVLLEWRDPTERRWHETELISDRDRGNGWFRTSEPISMPENGDVVRYQISVTDSDGYEIRSEIFNYRPFLLPNLKTVSAELYGEGLIYPRFTDAKSTINADIEQTEDLPINYDVEVWFFDENPDRDRNGIIDDRTRIIGTTTVKKDQWQIAPKKVNDRLDENLPLAFTKTPLNPNPISTAKIDLDLSFSEYQIYIWIDPENKIREVNENDNISSRQIQINETVIGDRARHIFSRHQIADFRVQPNSIPKPTSLKILEISELPKVVNQPSLIAIGMPDKTLAIRTDSPENPISPITTTLRFDLEKLRRSVQTELGLANEILTADQKAVIEFGVQQQAKEISAFQWRDDFGKWLKLNSEIVTDRNSDLRRETIATNVDQNNFGNGTISEIEIDRDRVIGGRWVIFFTSPTMFRLMVSEKNDDGEDLPLRMIDENRDLESLGFSANFKDGLRMRFKNGDRDFQFGDLIMFEILASNGGDLYASSYRTLNRGNGTLQQITISNGAIADNWILYFLDSNQFRIEGERSGVLPKIGKVGEIFESNGIRLKITAGETDFVAGDRFRFSTREVGLIRTEITRFGTVTLWRSGDTIPPDLQMTIGGQNFISGDAVSKTPSIQATITDDNGIDLDSISFQIGRRLSLETIDRDDLEISFRKGANQLTINYQSPELTAGIYTAKLSAKDLDGNPSEREIEFQIFDQFQLSRAMNYPNPFTDQTTITYELTAPTDEMTIKIYTLSGRLIWQNEIDGTSGFVMVSWDGRDFDGDRVANGVYYCKITAKKSDAKDQTAIIKMMKLK